MILIEEGIDEISFSLHNSLIVRTPIELIGRRVVANVSDSIFDGLDNAAAAANLVGGDGGGGGSSSVHGGLFIVIEDPCMVHSRIVITRSRFQHQVNFSRSLSKNLDLQ